MDSPSRLLEWVEWRSGGELPAAPRILKLTTGKSPPSSERDCSEPPYPLQYELDLESGALGWSWCERDPETGELVEPRPSDSRVLGADELAAVLSAYDELAAGASGPCASLEVPEPAADGSLRVPRIEIDDDVVVFDEVVSCARFGSSAGGWAVGVKALTELVAGELAR